MRLAKQAKISGKEVLSMHPQAAADRRVNAGDLVRVFNERGACLAGVALDEYAPRCGEPAHWSLVQARGCRCSWQY